MDRDLQFRHFAERSFSHGSQVAFGHRRLAQVGHRQAILDAVFDLFRAENGDRGLEKVGLGHVVAPVIADQGGQGRGPAGVVGLLHHDVRLFQRLPAFGALLDEMIGGPGSARVSAG